MNLGIDHYGSELLVTLGVKFVDDGVDDNVRDIVAQSDSLLSDVNFDYAGGSSPRFSIDRLATTDSEILYQSSGDEEGRIFIKDTGDTFKAISSSVVFGALRDGDSLSMKPYLLAEIIDYLLGYTTITDIREVFGHFARHEAKAYPNPASDYTNISFKLSENTDVTLAIYDEMGRLIDLINKVNLSAGEQTISWNTRDLNGRKVDNGLYFYTIKISDEIISGKLLIQK